MFSSESILFLLVLVLLLLLQSGFLLFETGIIREKNSFNTAMKNLADLIIGMLAYLIAHELMRRVFGITRTESALILPAGQTRQFSNIKPSDLIAACYCITCVTICSGAIAERFKFGTYLALCGFTAAITFPLVEFVSWHKSGFLFVLGFFDRAGSGVVHLAGGAVALAAALRVGPRLGRFLPDGKVHYFPMSNVVNVCFGCLLMLVGWFGFNISSLDITQADIPFAATSIMLSCLGGGIAGLLFSYENTNRIFRVTRLTNGILAGLVATTASFDALIPEYAFLVGVSGALVCFLFDHILIKMRIDDAVSAAPVHCGGGIVGVLVAASITGKSLLPSLAVQFLGAVFLFFVPFLLTYFFLGILLKINFSLRPPESHEQAGLNLTEHGAPALADELAMTIATQRVTFNFNEKARVEPFTTIGAIAFEYNRLLEKLTSEFKSRLGTLEIESKGGLRVAALVHDLRSPLQALKAEAYILSTKHEVTHERLQKTVHLLEQQCDNMEEMIESVLQTSKTKRTQAQSQQDEHHADSDLATRHQAIWNEAFSRIRDLFSSECQNAGVRLELPICDNNQIAEIELINLVRVLSNLVSNALQALSNTSERKICVSLESRESDYLCQVLDSGPGISETILPRLFEPFLTTRKDGHGVGLASSRQILRDTHGDLWLAQSKPAIFAFRVRKAPLTIHTNVHEIGR